MWDCLINEVRWEILEMFRPIRRKKREISIELAKQLLLTSRRGVLAVNGDDGYPYAVPINYYYDEEADKIYFHGAKAGHKFESIVACDKVCFTVYGNESIRDEQWAPYVQSTVVFGRCHLINGEEQTLELAKRFALKYYPNEELVDEEIERYGQAVQMFEIEIEYMTGKEIKEK